MVADQFADYPDVLTVVGVHNPFAAIRKTTRETNWPLYTPQSGIGLSAQIVSALQETNELAVNYQLLDYEKALRIRKPRNVAM